MRPKAFTMIELLIVVSIISILIVAFVNQFNLGRYFKRSRDVNMKILTREVKQALYRYYVNHNEYPGNLEEAGINVVMPDILNQSTNQSGQPYIYPPPDQSVAQGLIKDKELKSTSLISAQDINQLNKTPIADLKNFMFVANQQYINKADCDVRQNAVNLSQPKICYLVSHNDCLSAKSAKSANYYGVCENGGSIVGIVSLSDLSDSAKWPGTTQWIGLCQDYTTLLGEGGLKFGIYKCE